MTVALHQLARESLVQQDWITVHASLYPGSLGGKNEGEERRHCMHSAHVMMQNNVFF